MRAKTTILIIALLLVVIIAVAMVLYNVLADKAGSEDLPLLTTSGQQADSMDESSQPPNTQATASMDETSQSPVSGEFDVIEGETQANQAGATQQPVNDQDNGDEEPDAGGIKAPDFTVQDAGGSNVKLSDMRGKPVVLNFWASWCPPCRGEMPGFDEVYRELGDEVQFMMVCLVDGSSETKASGMAFIEENGFVFPVYYDVMYDAAMAYEIWSIPVTYFINARGEIVSSAEGSINEAALRQGIGYISD